MLLQLVNFTDTQLRGTGTVYKLPTMNYSANPIKKRKKAYHYP